MYEQDFVMASEFELTESSCEYNFGWQFNECLKQPKKFEKRLSEWEFSVKNIWFGPQSDSFYSDRFISNIFAFDDNVFPEGQLKNY